VFGLILVLLCTAAGRADTATGLVGYWPLDGDAKDASGNGLDGTISKVTPAADRLGKANAAMSFTGASDCYLNVADNTKLQFTGEMTLAAWVLLDKNNKNNSRIVAKSGGSGRRSWSLNIEASSGGVTFPPHFAGRPPGRRQQSQRARYAAPADRRMGPHGWHLSAQRGHGNLHQRRVARDRHQRSSRHAAR